MYRIGVRTFLPYFAVGVACARHVGSALALLDAAGLGVAAAMDGAAAARCWKIPEGLLFRPRKRMHKAHFSSHTFIFTYFVDAAKQCEGANSRRSPVAKPLQQRCSSTFRVRFQQQR